MFIYYIYCIWWRYKSCCIEMNKYEIILLVAVVVCTCLAGVWSGQMKRSDTEDSHKSCWNMSIAASSEYRRAGCLAEKILIVAARGRSEELSKRSLSCKWKRTYNCNPERNPKVLLAVECVKDESYGKSTTKICQPVVYPVPVKRSKLDERYTKLYTTVLINIEAIETYTRYSCKQFQI